jgi:hypothetical protein
MEKEQGIVKISCILQGAAATRFLQIKEAKGIHNNTEVVRSLINDWWNNHQQEGQGVKREK